jgi:hypothetical protein
METTLAGWGGRIRTLESRDATAAAARLDRNGGTVRTQYSLQNGLDFCCEWSVSVAMPMRAAWPYLDPAPLAMPPLWGFGGDGA